MSTSRVQSIAIRDFLNENGIRNYGAWFSRAHMLGCVFKYGDGTTVDFDGWAYGEPDDCGRGTESCAYIAAGVGGGWYDEAGGCGSIHCTVCQPPGIKIPNHLSIQMDKD